MGIKRGPCRHASITRATFLALSFAHVVRCFGGRRRTNNLLTGIMYVNLTLTLTLNLILFLILALTLIVTPSVTLTLTVKTNINFP